MKLFLFGGAELGEAAEELKMIESVIHFLKPKQLLHVSFARTKDSSREERNGDWFDRNISLPGIQYLNAANPEDMAQVDNPVIFISGGSEHVNLIEQINATSGLLDIIRNADYIIGESAGSKVLGSYYITQDSTGNNILLPSLNIIKNTLLEGHYMQRNKEPKLVRGMKESGISIGLGIDSLTAMVIDLSDENYLSNYEKIGKRDIVVVQK